MDPLSLRVPAHRRTPFPSSAAGLDLAAQLGEVEQQQLWIVAPVDAELSNISVVPQALAAQQRAASGALDLKDATFVEPDEWVGLPKVERMQHLTPSLSPLLPQAPPPLLPLQ